MQLLISQSKELMLTTLSARPAIISLLIKLIIYLCSLIFEQFFVIKAEKDIMTINIFTVQERYHMHFS